MDKNWWFAYPWDFYNGGNFFYKNKSTVIQIRKTFYSLEASNFSTILYFPFIYDELPLILINKSYIS